MQFFLNTGGNPLMTILFFVIIVGALWFFMIRPQKKQEKAAQEMRDSLEVGDEIITIGGIIGQVVSVKGETMTIVTSKDRTKIRLLRTAVREVTVKINAPSMDEAPAKAPEKEKNVEAAPVKDESDKKGKSKKAEKAAKTPETEPAEPTVEEPKETSSEQ